MTISKQLLEAKICNKNTCELQERINKAIENLNYYIEGMNKSLEIWNKVKEDEKIDDDTLLQMLEREKQNYIDLLDILKGSDKE